MPKAFALAFSLTSPNISIPSILLSILQSGKLESVVSHQQLGLSDLGDLDGRHIKCVITRYGMISHLGCAAHQYLHVSTLLQ